MHLFYLREAARSFRHHRGLAYTAILSLTAALTLTGVLLLLTHNAQLTLNHLGDRREMVVYLRDDVTASQRDLMIGRLNDLYGATTYVSKEDAWAEFTRDIGDAALLEAVEENPLPASLRIKLKPELQEPAAMDLAARQISEFPEVEDVRYGQEWVRRLYEMGGTLVRGTVVVGFVVAVAIVFILYNTLRLTVLARRREVEIMSRLGATDGFIATPFVLEAMFEAALSAFLSLALIFGLQQALTARVIGIQFLPWQMLLAYIGVTIFCAWLAAMLTLRRVLRAVGA